MSQGITFRRIRGRIIPIKTGGGDVPGKASNVVAPKPAPTYQRITSSDRFREGWSMGSRIGRVSGAIGGALAMGITAKLGPKRLIQPRQVISLVGSPHIKRVIKRAVYTKPVKSVTINPLKGAFGAGYGYVSGGIGYGLAIGFQNALFGHRKRRVQ